MSLSRAHVDGHVLLITSTWNCEIIMVSRLGTLIAIGTMVICISVQFTSSDGSRGHLNSQANGAENPNRAVVDDSQISTDKWNWIKLQPKDRKLGLIDRKLDRNAIRVIAGISDLQYLALPGCGVIDEDLAQICAMPNLVVLDLSRNDITDKGGTQLNRLPKLQFAILDRTQVGDQTMEALASRGQLTRLWLGHTQVTGESLPCLALCRDLIELKLNGNALRSQPWQGIVSLTSLQWLEISNTTLTAPDLEYLAPLVHLRNLSVFGCRGIADDNMALFARFPFLERLDVGRSSITNNGVRTLASSKNLRSLSLIGTRVTDGVVEIVEQNNQWRYVNISHCNVSYDVLKKSKAHYRIEGTGLGPRSER